MKPIKMYDFKTDVSQKYTEKCECGREIEVSSQKYNNPEYTTIIYIRCTCGESVEFELPVN